MFVELSAISFLDTVGVVRRARGPLAGIKGNFSWWMEKRNGENIWITSGHV